MNSFKMLTAMLATLTLVNCGGSSHMTGREPYKHHGEQIENTKIITHVRHAFRTNHMIPKKLVYVAVDRGIVQLSGFVHNNAEADLTILAARNARC